MRSFEDSLQRLGFPWVDCLLIHDLDSMFHNEQNLQAHIKQLITSGWKALEELRRNGLVQAVGAGVPWAKWCGANGFPTSSNPIHSSVNAQNGGTIFQAGNKHEPCSRSPEPRR